MFRSNLGDQRYLKYKDYIQKHILRDILSLCVYLCCKLFVIIRCIGLCLGYHLQSQSTAD